MIQTLLCFLYQLCLIVLFFVLSISWGIACYITSLFPGGEDRAHKYLINWARICLGLTRCHITVAGLEHLDSSRPYVFMPNHASFLDILLVFAFIPDNFRIIVKKEFFSIPILGLTVRSSGQIPLDRKHPRQGLQSIKKAAYLLNRGVSVVVFPEGTRSRDGKIHDFRKTLFVLPIRTQTPVAPVLIQGTFEALRAGSVMLRRYPLKMTFLTPIAADTQSDGDRALYAERVRQSLLHCGQNPMAGANVSMV